MVLVNTLNSHTFEDESKEDKELEETIKLSLQEYELSKKRKK